MAGGWQSWQEGSGQPGRGQPAVGRRQKEPEVGDSLQNEHVGRRKKRSKRIGEWRKGGGSRAAVLPWEWKES